MKKALLIVAILLLSNISAYSSANKEVFEVVSIQTVLIKGDLAKFNEIKEFISDWNVVNSDGDSLPIILIKSFILFEKKYLGRTALHFAAEQNDIEIVKALVEKRANLFARDKNGKIPYHLALELKNYAVAEYLNQEMKKTDSTIDDGVTIIDDEYNLRKKEYYEIFTQILENCTNINHYNSSGLALIHYLVEYGDIHLMEKIIKKGVNLNQRNKQNQNTPLIMAVCKGYPKIVKLLLDNDADLFAIVEGGDEIEKKYNNSSNVSFDPQNNNSDKNEPVNLVKYKKPDKFNLKIIIEGFNIKNPEKDLRTYFQVYVDKIHLGRTSIALDSQFKEFTAAVAPNKHLVRLEKFSLDIAKKKYIRLNNVFQPKPNFFYINLPQDKIVLLRIKVDSESGKTLYSYDFVKENDL